MNSQVLHTVRCSICGEAAGEIWHWSLLGVKGLNQRMLLASHPDKLSLCVIELIQGTVPNNNLSIRKFKNVMFLWEYRRLE